MRDINIAGRKIGPGHPCFVIAEAGVNHNGDLELARRLVDVAADAGADAVKFQTFTAERLATTDAPKADYQMRTTDGTESQIEMLRRLELSPEAHRSLMEQCQERNILFLSSPFDEESADLLAELGVAAIKIPSGEITNLPYLEHIAQKGKPMIVSTGMASLGEVEQAIRTIEGGGNQEFVLLHCVSNYPAKPADINLRAMETLKAAFGAPTGYSDHTPGNEVALASVALGACVVEKHFTLDRSMPGPDHEMSLEPDELDSLIRGIRLVSSALGDGRKEPVPSEAETAAVARKSLVAAIDIPAGTILTEELIAIKRPGTGLPPAMRQQLTGRETKETVPSGTLITLEMLT
ncbi:N-acetylneuraminate synthase [Dehalococcoidia bacterium]|nr:N-acetylneuraminate synthase [Dehalococcoidia bacterium]